MLGNTRITVTIQARSEIQDRAKESGDEHEREEEARQMAKQSLITKSQWLMSLKPRGSIPSPVWNNSFQLRDDAAITSIMNVQYSRATKSSNN